VSVLRVNDEIVGTGSFVDNHITRIYVSPEQQKKGYGTFILKAIESEIAKKYDRAYLDTSLSAVILYEKFGYKTKMHMKHPLENGAVLVYEIMEKELHHANTNINYDGKVFLPI
jgi:ribosomal protein S18 acetylase RimI-like enzyme